MDDQQDTSALVSKLRQAGILVNTPRTIGASKLAAILTILTGELPPPTDVPGVGSAAFSERARRRGPITFHTGGAAPPRAGVAALNERYRAALAAQARRR